jgi:hypothetical protein
VDVCEMIVFDKYCYECIFVKPQDFVFFNLPSYIVYE